MEMYFFVLTMIIVICMAFLLFLNAKNTIREFFSEISKDIKESIKNGYVLFDNELENLDASDFEKHQTKDENECKNECK